MKKKIISLTLVLVMLISMIPSGTFAATANQYTSVATVDKTSVLADGKSYTEMTIYTYDSSNHPVSTPVYMASSRGNVDSIMGDGAYKTTIATSSTGYSVVAVTTDANGKAVVKISSDAIGISNFGVFLTAPGTPVGTASTGLGTDDYQKFLSGVSNPNYNATTMGQIATKEIEFTKVPQVNTTANQYTSVAAVDKTSVPADNKTSVEMTIYTYDSSNQPVSTPVYIASSRGNVDSIMGDGAYKTTAPPSNTGYSVVAVTTDASGKAVVKILSGAIGISNFGVFLTAPGTPVGTASTGLGTDDYQKFLSGVSNPNYNATTMGQIATKEIEFTKVPQVNTTANQYTSVAAVDKTSVPADNKTSVEMTIYTYDSSNQPVSTPVYIASSRGNVDSIMGDGAYKTTATPSNTGYSVVAVTTDASGKAVVKISSGAIGISKFGVFLTAPGKPVGTTSTGLGADDYQKFLSGVSNPNYNATTMGQIATKEIEFTKVPQVNMTANQYTSVAAVDKTSVPADNKTSVEMTIYTYDSSNQPVSTPVYIASSRGNVDSIMGDDAYKTTATTSNTGYSLVAVTTDASGKAVVKISSGAIGISKFGVFLTAPGKPVGTTSTGFGADDYQKFLSGVSNPNYNATAMGQITTKEIEFAKVPQANTTANQYTSVVTVNKTAVTADNKTSVEMTIYTYNSSNQPVSAPVYIASSRGNADSIIGNGAYKTTLVASNSNARVVAVTTDAHGKAVVRLTSGAGGISKFGVFLTAPGTPVGTASTRLGAGDYRKFLNGISSANYSAATLGLIFSKDITFSHSHQHSKRN